jgi:F-type H+-transporting ATPase subunit epsilon
MFTLTLVTPEKRLVAGQEIEEIFVPAFMGELNILPGHAPLMTILRPGVLRYRLKGENDVRAVAVSTGYAQVFPQGVKVLAEAADRAEDLENELVDQEFRDAQAALMASSSADASEIEKLQNRVATAQARKDVAASRGNA